jgi:hypothetical protein
MLGYKSGARVYSINRKSRGRKSRAIVPLTYTHISHTFYERLNWDLKFCGQNVHLDCETVFWEPIVWWYTYFHRPVVSFGKYQWHYA